MTEQAMDGKDYAVISRDGLEALITTLRTTGHDVVGPTVRGGAIVYGRLSGITDLPEGWTERQAPGSYSLERRDDHALFGYAVGPHSWKQFLHTPVQRLWQAQRGEGGLKITAECSESPKYAFIGVRACELRAIAIQDRIFLSGSFRDPHYAAARERLFVVAVNCGEAAATCFCASMNAGPGVDSGFDLALTELLREGTQRFLVETGSDAGRSVLERIPRSQARTEDVQAARRVVETTARQMGRRLETDGLKKLLEDNREHPRWEEVAERCLACGNCTMVCPTCFCTTIEDHSDLAGNRAERVRKWDSCFTLDFSYIHGGSVRQSGASRYRHWMTHKLSSWHDQFGTAGCVGCGRCITWCPAGIDITEEAAAIRATPSQSSRRKIDEES